MGYIPVPPPPKGLYSTFMGKRITEHRYDPDTGKHQFDLENGQSGELTEKEWFNCMVDYSDPFRTAVIYPQDDHCSYCGVKSRPADRFCTQCGAPL